MISESFLTRVIQCNQCKGNGSVFCDIHADEFKEIMKNLDY